MNMNLKALLLIFVDVIKCTTSADTQECHMESAGWVSLLKQQKQNLAEILKRGGEKAVYACFCC